MENTVYKAEIIKVNPEEFGLDAAKGTEMESIFTPVIAERDAYIGQFNLILTSEITEGLIVEAHDLRMKLVKIRTNTERIHKTAKAFYIAGGKYVDAWKNRNTETLEQMEEKLKGVENHYINIETTLAQSLKATRVAELAKVCDNPELYQVELMTELAFRMLLEGQELVKQSREKVAALAETKRLADLELQKLADAKQKAENERLRLISEAQKETILKQQGEAKEQAEQATRALNATAAKAALELKAANEEKADLLAKIKKVEAADKLEREQKAESERLAKIAPLKVQVEKWLTDLNFGAFESENVTVKDIEKKFNGFKNWAQSQLNSL